MLTGIATFVATTTGKVVVGTTVAAASVGGLHAVEVVDVPLLPDVVQVEDVDEQPTLDGEVAGDQGLIIEDVPGEEITDELLIDDELDAVEPDQDEVEDADGDEVESEADDDQADDEGEGDTDGDDDERRDNHGALVSEFARNTELEGREKGQAIAELASSKKNDDAEENIDTDEAPEPEGPEAEDLETEKAGKPGKAEKPAKSDKPGRAGEASKRP